MSSPEEVAAKVFGGKPNDYRVVLPGDEFNRGQIAALEKLCIDWFGISSDKIIDKVMDNWRTSTLDKQLAGLILKTLKELKE